MALRLKANMTIFLKWGRLGKLFILILMLMLWNEYLLYYVVLLQCSWPTLNPETADLNIQSGVEKALKVMIFGDTHLLGRGAHWFDKLRREWQMQRCFQTAMSIHNPQVIFVLGDLLDEGKWCGDIEFDATVQRFQSMFSHASDSLMFAVVGNHDVGFHYRITQHKLDRFNSQFKSPHVKLIEIQGNIFILLNSMAFEGDHCLMCHEAQKQLADVVNSLECAKSSDTGSSQCMDKQLQKYTKPIILQHFPLYRKSDANCTGPDSAPLDEKYIPFRPRWDCLSEEASNMLLTSLEPRLVMSAHTHNFCYREVANGIPEWTVPSFSWRNKQNPSFLLAVISNNNYAIHKCYLPDERTVIWTYIIGGAVLVVWFMLPCRHIMRNSRGTKIQ